MRSKFFFAILVCVSAVSGVATSQDNDILDQELFMDDWDGEKLEVEEDFYAYYLPAALWVFPLATEKLLPVCWENPSGKYPTNRYAQEKKWIRDAVNDNWGKVTGIKFDAWDECKKNSIGIRVHLLDSFDGAAVKEFGSKLDGIHDGIRFDVQLDWIASLCGGNRKGCIKHIAVHEFGHALGFLHEQDRTDDKSNKCTLKTGSDPGKTIGAYDINSVMNYCRDEKSWNGDLSINDCKAAKKLYAPSSAANCSTFFKLKP